MTENTDDKNPDGNPSGNPLDAESARIAKVIARAGIASRRDAEAMIEAGRVMLNGKIISSPAVNVGPRDRIAIDGEPLPARERTRLWLYHKPRGLVTTAKDPEGRPTVFDVLPEELPRVVSIGRLDLNTEGLLLLTNDGGLARVLGHPDTAWLRRYRVRAYGDVSPDALHALNKGIEIEGFSYGPIEAELDRKQGDNVWLTLGLREGKNREVRKVLEHLGLSVNRLIRISFGPFQLGDMPEGSVEEIRTRYLRDQLGGLAEEAGCDFDAPIVDREAVSPRRAARAARGAARDEARDGPRHSAGLVTDRRGRRVLVERFEKEKPAERPASARPVRSDDTRSRRPDADQRPSRPREDRPRRDGEAPRPFRSRDDRPQRDERRGPPRDAESRPPRRDGDAPRPFRAREDRPQGDQKRRGPPRDAGSRPPRRDGDAPRPFRAREDRAGAPARPPSDAPRRGSPRERDMEPRPDGNRKFAYRAKPDRPPYEERGEPRDARGRDDRPPRRDGDKPRAFGARPGGRPEGDRRDGKPSGPGRPGGFSKGPRGKGPGPGGKGGSRPGGVRPSGGKPSGGRPSGGRPPGGRPAGGGGGKRPPRV